MNSRMLTVGISIVLALVGTGAVYVYVKNADARAIAGKQAASVLVIQRLIPAGTSVKVIQAGGYVQAERVPATSAPADAVTQLSSEVATLVATTDLQPGQILLRASLGSVVPTTGGLNIPAGMLAVSFRVATPADVAGYVQPTSQIAIFDTYKPVGPSSASHAPSDGDQVTRLLLPRVQVLAVSTAAPTSTDKAVGSGTLLVTVALNQDDTERLIHEEIVGSLYIALLSQSSKVAPAPGVDSSGLLGPIFPAVVAP